MIWGCRTSEVMTGDAKTQNVLRRIWVSDRLLSHGYDKQLLLLDVVLQNINVQWREQKRTERGEDRTHQQRTEQGVCRHWQRSRGTGTALLLTQMAVSHSKCWEADPLSVPNWGRRKKDQFQTRRFRLWRERAPKPERLGSWWTGSNLAVPVASLPPQSIILTLA